LGALSVAKTTNRSKHHLFVLPIKLENELSAPNCGFANQFLNHGHETIRSQKATAHTANSGRKPKFRDELRRSKSDSLRPLLGKKRRDTRIARQSGYVGTQQDNSMLEEKSTKQENQLQINV
jgi:hypothetical protein